MCAVKLSVEHFVKTTPSKNTEKHTNLVSKFMITMITLSQNKMRDIVIISWQHYIKISRGIVFYN